MKTSSHFKNMKFFFLIKGRTGRFHNCFGNWGIDSDSIMSLEVWEYILLLGGGGGEISKREVGSAKEE